MTSSKPVVAIVDPQANAIESLTRLAKTLDVEVRSYVDAKSFLSQENDLNLACLIIEMNLPDDSGMHVLKILKQRAFNFPIIMLSSNSKVSDAVDAMHAGCVDFIEKPFIDRLLVQKIERAVRDFMQKNNRH